MLLFSSTYDDEVMKFAKTVVPDPIIIRLRREEESLDNIKQYYVVCRDKEDKFQALSNMYGVVSIGQCIVFCHVSVKINSFPPPPFSFPLIPIRILPRPGKRLQSSLNLVAVWEMFCNPRMLLHLFMPVSCQTRKAASWLAEKMTADGHSVALLSGEITVEQRLAVLNRFRDGKEKLLITTNVSARGIDVEQVSTYWPPLQSMTHPLVLKHEFWVCA